MIRVEGLAPQTPGHVVGREHDAGRYLYRLALSEPGRRRMQSAASSSISMGYLGETYGDMLLAVDAADEDSATVLSRYLENGELAGEWVLETGRQ